MPRYIQRNVPAGLLTGEQAQNVLGVSDTTLREYVKDELLRKYGVPGSKQRPYYSEKEVNRLRTRLNGTYEIRASFEQALEKDIDSIIIIDKKTFPEEGAAASLDTLKAWYRANPHTFYVVRDAERVVRGYASLIPTDKKTVEEFIHDAIDGENILDKILQYEPGREIAVYCMAIAVDPDFVGTWEGTYYGRQLIEGTKTFLLSLAERGIDIASITARSYKQDGLRLLRRLNIPQLRSPVERKSLFQLDLRTSGIKFAEDYRELLDTWKEKNNAINSNTHQPAPPFER